MHLFNPRMKGNLINFVMLKLWKRCLLWAMTLHFSLSLGQEPPSISSPGPLFSLAVPESCLCHAERRTGERRRLSWLAADGSSSLVSCRTLSMSYSFAGLSLKSNCQIWAGLGERTVHACCSGPLIPHQQPKPWAFTHHSHSSCLLAVHFQSTHEKQKDKISRQNDWTQAAGGTEYHKDIL